VKFVVAMMEHETNTFSSLPTPFEAFAGPTGLPEPPSGQAAIETWGGADMGFSAFLALAREEGAEIDVPIAAYAEPSGPVADAAFERIAGQICAAVAKGCDAVLLDLHGAMVTESRDDGEGALLARIRQVAPQVPIAVSLDFHTNLTAEMVANATVITGYCTYPHVDMPETARRAGRTLLRALRGEVRPRMVWGALPLLTHMIRQTPAKQPMKDVMDLALAAEGAGGVLNASVFGGFPLADIPHAALSALIVGEEGDAAAEALLQEILALAWERRPDFIFETEPVARTIERAKALTDGPVILADEGDNCGAGGSMDDMTVIAEILRQGLSDVAAGPIWDPQALAIMREAGVGAEVTVAVGGRTDSPAISLKGRPLTLSGTVRNVTDGRFRIEGPMMTGFEVDLGGSAVLDTGPVQVLVSGERAEPFDLTFMTHAGIDPRAKTYVVVKSRQHFRAGFEPIARHILMVSGPGVCGSDYGQFPFRKLTRPIYPLDPETAYSPPRGGEG
jgi:microcystin degradation protein MlrC